MYYGLSKTSLKIEKEKALPLVYEKVRLECGYRMDNLAEEKVIVELKSVEALSDIRLAQILTYLKLSNNKVGLLINFNSLRLINNIKRVVNNY